MGWGGMGWDEVGWGTRRKVKIERRRGEGMCECVL
jgi:hypothetical protein